MNKSVRVGVILCAVAGVLESGVALAGAPPLASTSGAVQIPAAATSSGSVALSVAWQAGGSNCMNSLLRCTSPGVPAGCDTPIAPPIGAATGPLAELCNEASTGLLQVQSCPGGSTGACLTGSGNDVPGDAAVGVSFAVPFQGYDTTYDLVMAVSASVQYYCGIDDSGWPFGGVSCAGNLHLYVYDATTGAVAAQQAVSVYTGSAFGFLKGVTAASSGPIALAPISLTLSATAGHTYQAWLWADVDSNASVGVNGFPADQFMDVTVGSMAWQATAVPLPASAAPEITGMSPSVGNAGADVTLTGKNFNPAFPPSVSFGGISSPAVSCPSTTTCYAIVPNGGEDFVPVTAAFAPSFSQAVGEFFYQACTAYAGSCGGAVEVQCSADPAGYPIQVRFSQVGSLPLTETLPASGWAEDLGGTITVETCTLTPDPECAPSVVIASNENACIPPPPVIVGGGGGGGGGYHGPTGCVGPCKQ